jgi:DNA adenine methylase
MKSSEKLANIQSFPNNSNWLELIRHKNRKLGKIEEIPKPFIKWAGGKRQLLKEISKVIPAHFETYIEPFVGGGAVFFYLLPSKAILMDNNPILINVYKVIKNNVNALIPLLQAHQNNKEYFYEIRKADRMPEFKNWSEVKQASRFIYLNRCCFNGLFRVNSKGYFNVPFGRYKNPNFCDIPNLNAVNRALQHVTILNASFEKCLDYAKKDDFIYFDPPYMPISDTANFTSYTKDNFTKEDQVKLAKVFKKLDIRGCKVLLSNSYCEFINDLYSDYEILVVDAKRAINSDATKRGAVKEVLVRNYPH